MQKIITLIIGADKEFIASFEEYLETLDDNLVAQVESQLNEGLAVVAALQPDLVLVNVDLVDADDESIVMRFRALPKATRVFLLAMFDKDVYARQLRALQVDGIISRETFAEEFEQLLRGLRREHSSQS